MLRVPCTIEVECTIHVALQEQLQHVDIWHFEQRLRAGFHQPALGRWGRPALLLHHRVILRRRVRGMRSPADRGFAAMAAASPEERALEKRPIVSAVASLLRLENTAQYLRENDETI